MSMPKLIIQRTLTHYRIPLFQELSQDGWQVVCASNFPQDAEGLHTQHAPQTFALKLPFFFPIKSRPYLCHVPLFKILKTYKPQTILLEAGTTMTSTWLAALLCRLKLTKNTRIYLWGHGAPIGKANPLKTALKKWLIQSVHGYLCYTEADKAALINMGVRTPVFAAQNTIDISVPQKLREKPPVRPVQNFLFVGRLTADKNIHKLVSIFLELTHKQPHLSLTIIGDGPEKEHLHKLAQNSPHITFTGALYDEEQLAKHYNKADVYITLGAAGLGINHAMAYGLPVLCFAGTPQGPFHHPEIAYVQDKKTGWVVQPFSTKGMKNQMEHIIKNKAKADMFDTITHYADTQLSIKAMAHNIKEMEAHI